MVEHPSGIEDEDELARISLKFWMSTEIGVDSIMEATHEDFNKLLAFQQGWKACKDFYKIK